MFIRTYIYEFLILEQDTWTDDDGKIHVDLQQDCENFTWKRQNNVTYFTFSRKLDTCDEHDYIIEVDQITVFADRGIRAQIEFSSSLWKIFKFIQLRYIDKHPLYYFDKFSNLLNRIANGQIFRFQRGTTHLVWLRGRGPLVSLAGLEVSNAEASGMARAELYRMPHKKPGLPIDAWKLQLLAHQVQVPNKETTYWCRVQKLPEVLRRKCVHTR